MPAVLPRASRISTIQVVASTLSEEMFEEFCAAKGISCVRIPETASQTPDYVLSVDSARIIVEVKEFAQTDQELESDRLLEERGYGNVLSYTPGERLRKKITDANPQLKIYTQGMLPTLLVVCDRGRAVGHADAYNIRVAMYGLEQLHIAVPPIGQGAPSATGWSYGPKRKMTAQTNTSISAIGHLYTIGPDVAQTQLHVYHNRFAKVALASSLLGRYGVRHFEIAAEAHGRTADWQEVIGNTTGST